jgi:hypothetical protein
MRWLEADPATTDGSLGYDGLWGVGKHRLEIERSPETPRRTQIHTYVSHGVSHRGAALYFYSVSSKKLDKTAVKLFEICFITLSGIA